MKTDTVTDLEQNQFMEIVPVVCHSYPEVQQLIQFSQNQLNDQKKCQATADTDAAASATHHAEATSLVRSSGRLSIRETSQNSCQC